jgi:hypothetical protein
MEAPQNRRFYGKIECPPLWPTYIGEKEWTLCKTNRIKARCYWEHPWGTHWELGGNILGTKEKWKINQGTLSTCWAFQLAAWNFYFQNCSSPFLAWANTPNYKLGVLILLYRVLNRLVCGWAEKMSWPMKLLDLVIWISLLSYLKWTYSCYLQREFLHITCALLF